ncbi:Trm112 family protein [Marinomonas ostreistagni]|uniref:Trm112 family protein n=1 Tax=Marinomonas ostreistagni TaxID=359209 RepID=UPI00194ECAF3|nr:Trm112 family protein [Marinomonas ostreistagni]MBM6549989.1 Trm112 family protein [Marinomonas ostreistagni]
MNKTLLDILVCPVTKAPLSLNEEGTELISKVGGMAYPVRDGIPVLLESEARTLSAEERLDDSAK